VLGETKHFTTFALMLMSEDGNACNSWIWPTSVALIGSSLLLVPVIVLLLSTKKMRAWFYGYQQGSRNIHSVVKELKKQQTDIHGLN